MTGLLGRRVLHRKNDGMTAAQLVVVVIAGELREVSISWVQSQMESVFSIRRF